MAISFLDLVAMIHRNMKKTQYEFIIKDFSPSTLKISRLAEYLKELSKIFGETHKIYFDRVDEGSVCLKFNIEERIEKKISEHLIKRFNSKEIQDSILQKLLEKDETSAILKISDGKMIQFPGIENPKKIKEFTISCERVTTGKIVSISGKDKTINVDLLDNGIEYYCLCFEDIVKKLKWGMYISAATEGYWIKTDEGWRTDRKKRLKIKNFKILKKQTPYETFKELTETKMISDETFQNIQQDIKKTRGYHSF